MLRAIDCTRGHTGPDGHSDPIAQYPELVARYEAPRLRPPFNLPARSAAGFSPEELAYLQG